MIHPQEQRRTSSEEERQTRSALPDKTHISPKKGVHLARATPGQLHAFHATTIASPSSSTSSSRATARQDPPATPLGPLGWVVPFSGASPEGTALTAGGLMRKGRDLDLSAIISTPPRARTADEAAGRGAGARKAEARGAARSSRLAARILTAGSGAIGKHSTREEREAGTLSLKGQGRGPLPAVHAHSSHTNPRLTYTITYYYAFIQESPEQPQRRPCIPRSKRLPTSTLSKPASRPGRPNGMGRGAAAASAESR